MVKKKNISDQEMMKTFNCGVGFCIIVNKEKHKKNKKIFSKRYRPMKLDSSSKTKNKVNLITP